VADERPPSPPEKPEQGRGATGGQDLWKYVGLGTQLAVTVILFVGIGWWLDQRYGWSPWGTLSLGMLGLAAGLYHFVKDALR
jgi:ATP synthase protein I